MSTEHKAVLLSIRPEWCVKILNGEKTVEIRKNRPKLKPPFKCYIYCTKAQKKFRRTLLISGMKFHLRAAWSCMKSLLMRG